MTIIDIRKVRWDWNLLQINW